MKRHTTRDPRKLFEHNAIEAMKLRIELSRQPEDIGAIEAFLKVNEALAAFYAAEGGAV